MILLLTVLHCLMVIHTLGISLICSSELYGKPSTSDSAMVLEALPFAKDDPYGQIDASRIFAEPALLEPRFSGLKNRLPTRMVQLPLIWRFSESIPHAHSRDRSIVCRLTVVDSARLALLMYADAGGRVRWPSVYMDWRAVEDAADTINISCMGGQRSGGVWIIQGTHKAVYAL